MKHLEVKVLHSLCRLACFASIRALYLTICIISNEQHAFLVKSLFYSVYSVFLLVRVIASITHCGLCVFACLCVFFK